ACSSSDSSDSSDCGCDSDSSSDSSDCSSSSSDCDGGKGKNVYDFLHEILKRICKLNVNVNCATEEEVRHIVCSKFDTLVGSKTNFPEECKHADVHTSKTLFQFLKEILRRI